MLMRVNQGSWGPRPEHRDSQPSRASKYWAWLPIIPETQASGLPQSSNAAQYVNASELIRLVGALETQDTNHTRNPGIWTTSIQQCLSAPKDVFPDMLTRTFELPPHAQGRFQNAERVTHPNWTAIYWESFNGITCHSLWVACRPKTH